MPVSWQGVGVSAAAAGQAAGPQRAGGPQRKGTGGGIAPATAALHALMHGLLPLLNALLGSVGKLSVLHA